MVRSTLKHRRSKQGRSRKNSKRTSRKKRKEWLKKYLESGGKTNKFYNSLEHLDLLSSYIPNNGRSRSAENKTYNFNNAFNGLNESAMVSFNLDEDVEREFKGMKFAQVTMVDSIRKGTRDPSVKLNLILTCHGEQSDRNTFRAPTTLNIYDFGKPNQTVICPQNTKFIQKMMADTMAEPGQVRDTSEGEMIGYKLFHQCQLSNQGLSKNPISGLYLYGEELTPIFKFGNAHHSLTLEEVVRFIDSEIGGNIDLYTVFCRYQGRGTVIKEDMRNRFGWLTY
jgi:hypothetical protein